MRSVLSRANQLRCRVHLLQLLFNFSNTNITLAMKFWLVSFSLRIWQVTWNTWYHSRAYLCNQRHGLRNVLSLQRTIPYTPMNPEAPSSIYLLRLFQPQESFTLILTAQTLPMAGFPLTSPNALGITIDPSLLSQPSSPDSTISPDIPLEPNSEEWPQDTLPEDIGFHLCNAQNFDATTQSAFPSPTTPVFDLDVQIRAHTQPPEDLHAEALPVEVRHPRDPRHSRCPRSPAQLQHLHQGPHDPRLRRANRRPSQHQLFRSISSFKPQRPLTGRRTSISRAPRLRRHRPQAPRSAPNLPPNAPFLIQQPWTTETTSPFPTISLPAPKDAALSDYPDLPIPLQRIPHTSFSLHVESQLAHLQHVISSMQTYLSQSYRCPDDEDERATVEK